MGQSRKTVNNDVTFEKLAHDDSGEAELSPGTRLGRYEIVRLLGRGGMGQVYLARHELQRTQHAVKILPSMFSARTGFVERFRTELRTMAAMQHPAIVHVTHSDVDSGRYYLVMDFVSADGGDEPYDLEEALAAEKRIEPETARRLAVQLCEGLAYAHRQGVVHRDLKPANVLLTSKDLGRTEVRICDFGLALVVGETEVRSLVAGSVRRSMSRGVKSTFVEKKREDRSRSGSVLGTYGYMSPEQEEGRLADARSDLYSVGVLLYRMVTGLRLRGMAKTASQAVPGLDPAWDRVIGKCLEDDPDKRWQTAEELKSALMELAKPSRRKKTPSRLFGVAALMLATCSLVIVFRLRSAYPALQERAVVFPQVPAADRHRLEAENAGVAVPNAAPRLDAPEVVSGVKSQPMSVPEANPEVTGLRISDTNPVQVAWQTSSPLAVAEPQTVQGKPPALETGMKEGLTFNAQYSTNDAQVVNKEGQRTVVAQSDAKDDTLEIRLEVEGGGRVFHRGDKVGFKIGLNRDCHVGLLCHQQDGSIVVLLPNRYHPESLVRGGEETLVPSAADPDFEIVIAPPYGTDKVELIACSGANEFHAGLEKTARQTLKGYGVLGPEEYERVLAMIARQQSIGNGEVAVKWSRAHVQVRTSE